ncbi:hypothetical protein Ancab_001796 [Ancistrocladus abbreviatus]
MKTARAWQFRLKEVPIMSGSRQRPPLKRPVWIIVLVSMVCIFLIAAYIYPLQYSAAAACNFFNSKGCAMYVDVPSTPSRALTDDETYSQLVVREILKKPSMPSKNPKIAFLFLTPGSLTFERLWDKFFQVAEEAPDEQSRTSNLNLEPVSILSSSREGSFVNLGGSQIKSYSKILGHKNHDQLASDEDWVLNQLAAKLNLLFGARGKLAAVAKPVSELVSCKGKKPVHVSRYFVGRDIRSDKVDWGKISMVDAERRLLAYALRDPDNQHFVLLSDSCVPLHNFDYVYNFLIFTNVSFIDCFVDPGPHGTGRYSEHMLPEVETKDFRKGSQWFTMKRQHAIIVMADSLYYTKFRLYCKPGMEHGKNCYADEHYLPTFFHMIDPGGIANWSVTHVDWSEGKWHPKSYRAQDVTYELLKNMTLIDESLHVTSDQKKTVMLKPCMWNGQRRPCYLFARKFYPETLDKLMHLFSNYTVV